MLPKYKVDQRSPFLEEVVIKDHAGVGVHKLLAELIDVVLSEKGHWEGINDAFVNRTIQPLGGVCTWPKRIRDIEFSDPEAKVIFNEDIANKKLVEELKLPQKTADKIISEGKAALLKGEIISVFPFKIIAKPGTRMTAKYLHEWY